MNWFEFFLFLVSKRRIMLLNFLITSVLSVVVAMLLQKHYKSEITFLPPEANQSFNIAGLLNLGVTMPDVNILNSYYNLNTEHIKMIIESNDVRHKMIDKFDLIKSYDLKKSKKPYTDASKILSKLIKVEEVEHAGLGFAEIVGFTVSITDTSAVRSYEMVTYFFEQVQSVVNTISNEKARHARKFIESQIANNRGKLEKAQDELYQFQVKYKALDLPSQIKESLKMYAELKSAILLKSIELDLAKGDYLGDARGTSVLKNQIATMNKRLAMLEKKDAADYMVGLDIAPELYYQYIQLSKDVEMYQKMDLVLIQTNELAKIQEMKAIATLQVIDPPGIPEYKYKPKRRLVVIFLVTGEMMFLLCLLLTRFFYRNVLVYNDEYNRLVAAFRKSR